MHKLHTISQHLRPLLLHSYLYTIYTFFFFVGQGIIYQWGRVMLTILCTVSDMESPITQKKKKKSTILVIF